MEFIVRIENGDVFINGKFTDQLCFDADAIGSAVANYIKDNYGDGERINEKVPDIPDDTKIPFMKTKKIWENQIANEKVPDIPDDVKIPFMKNEKMKKNLLEFAEDVGHRHY